MDTRDHLDEIFAEQDWITADPYSWRDRGPLDTEVPSFRVSDLYRQSRAIEDAQVLRRIRTPQALIWVSVWGDEERLHSTPYIQWLDAHGGGDVDPVGHTANEVVWRPWRYGSRRAWVRCLSCGKPVSRMFINLLGDSLGILQCHRCVGVHYASQRVPSMEDKQDPATLYFLGFIDWEELVDRGLWRGKAPNASTLKALETMERTAKLRASAGYARELESRIKELETDNRRQARAIERLQARLES